MDKQFQSHVEVPHPYPSNRKVHRLLQVSVRGGFLLVPIPHKGSPSARSALDQPFGVTWPVKRASNLDLPQHGTLRLNVAPGQDQRFWTWARFTLLKQGVRYLLNQKLRGLAPSKRFTEACLCQASISMRLLWTPLKMCPFVSWNPLVGVGLKAESKKHHPLNGSPSKKGHTPNSRLANSDLRKAPQKAMALHVPPPYLALCPESPHVSPTPVGTLFPIGFKEVPKGKNPRHH